MTMIMGSLSTVKCTVELSYSYSSTEPLNLTSVLITVNTNGKGIKLLTKVFPTPQCCGLSEKCLRHSVDCNFLGFKSQFTSIKFSFIYIAPIS